MSAARCAALLLRVLLCLGTASASADKVVAQAPSERIEHFDRDPGWDAHNNRPNSDTVRTVRQDFGYSLTSNSGGPAGEVGGFVTPAAEPAFYACKIQRHTLDEPLTASGTLYCPSRKFHILLGFFNSTTLNEWRTPNTIAIRLLGRGDSFYAFVEYATQKWRAGGDSPGGFATVADPDTGKKKLQGFALSTVYHWSLRYDPTGNGGAGCIQVTLGDQTSVCNLNSGHKADGAVFDHFGLLNVMKSAVTGGNVWLGNIEINGVRQDLTRDPHWDGMNNHRTYDTTDVRPQGDFGYSPTNYAGGQSKGELGGLVFRGDCRYQKTMACYGDRLQDLTLDKPLKASGRVSLQRGVSDSATLIGFYNSKYSMSVNDSQKSILPMSFLGVCIEGPSREGFLFYPVYRTRDKALGVAKHANSPPILPDGASHTWSLTYLPNNVDGKGRIVVTLDNRTVSLDMQEGDKTTKTHFDRFGIVTTWIDGNGQRVYFDDLTYTYHQP